MPKTLGLISTTGATMQNKCNFNKTFFYFELFFITGFLFRDARVPRPRIRVGFIPGGSTDSVSHPSHDGGDGDSDN